MNSLPDAFDHFAMRILPPGLSDAAHVRFQTLARYEKLECDQSLDFSDAGPHILFLARGAIKLVAHASRSRDQIVAFHFGGEMLSVPRRDHYSYSVCALRQCRIVSFPTADFLQLAADDAKVMGCLLERATLSLQRCREKAIALGRKTASERIAIFLIGMADRIGNMQQGRVLLDLPMSRRDIAESLGLTIETVSRRLSALRAEGAIETVGRSAIILNDLPGLHSRAGFLREAA